VKTESRIRLKSTAYHEAGHAVMAVHLKVPFALVSIDKDNDSAGQTYWSRSKRVNPELHFPLPHWMRAMIECHAIALLAGDAAERRFRPRRRFAGHSDKRDAYELLAFLDEGPRALELRERLARVLAKHYVDDLWDEIRAVARALMKYKKLKAAKVEAIVSQRLGSAIQKKWRVRTNQN
jgi:hypothetical protein